MFPEHGSIKLLRFSSLTYTSCESDHPNNPILLPHLRDMGYYKIFDKHSKTHLVRHCSPLGRFTSTAYHPVISSKRSASAYYLEGYCFLDKRKDRLVRKLPANIAN